MNDLERQAERRAECPNCGAPIVWRLASSHAAVCSYCRFSVVRSDRDLSSLGKVADLVPTAAPLAVGDEGTVEGRSFRVLGRQQLDHGRGPWDEWYLGFADRDWGWLARAEGRWYLTFPCACPDAPAWEALTPGSETQLTGTGSLRWKVAERGGAALLSAEGELPFAVDPQASGRYVDLEGEAGAFATLDYGDGSTPVQLFAGRELAPSAIALRHKVLGPRPTEKVAVQRLACPTCGAPIPVFVPSETERCGCAACGALLDHRAGALRLLVQLEPPPLAPLIPLGSQGSLLGEQRTVIGFMQRLVHVSGEIYAFREYLLHGDGGYAWLVEENHHWLYVAPVPASEVREGKRFAEYGGVRHRAFARGRPRVDFVIGEFYWKVAQGDEVDTLDYIAPPRVLSVERSLSEVSWSAGHYVEPEIVREAFGLSRLPAPEGIAAAQPNPHAGGRARYVLALLVFLWFLLAFAYEWGNRKPVLMETSLLLPPAGAQHAVDTQSSTPSRTVFSQPFTIKRGPTTIELTLDSPIDNGWVQLEAALVPEGGGPPRELSVLVEHYNGVSDGEAWSEGADRAQGYFGGVAPGTYTLRLTPSWEPYYMPGASAPPLPPAVHVRARQGARSAACSLATLALLVLPFVLRMIRRAHFEMRRNEQASL